MKPVIRWPGNKSKYAKLISQHFPDEYSRYIEPFVGSGALLFHTNPDKWIINDINKDLINVYNTVKENPQLVIKRMKQFGKTIKSFETNGERTTFCRAQLEKFASMPYDGHRASLFMILKYCAYMSNLIVKGNYYFTGLDSKFFKNTKSDLYFLTAKCHDNLLSVSNFFNAANGRIFNTDYKAILKKAKRNDFVFIDPPYVEDYDYHISYNISNNNDIVKELYSEVRMLDTRGVHWLMTQADTPAVRDTFKEYNMIPFQVFRGFTNSYKTELIIKNY